MGLDSSSLGMLGDFSSVFPSPGEPLLANGTMCSCDSCMERRQITQEHQQETKALQTVWTNLRTMVRKLYAMELTTLSEEDSATFRELVDKYVVFFYPLSCFGSFDLVPRICVCVCLDNY